VSYYIVLKGDNIALLVLKPSGCSIKLGIPFYMMEEVIFRMAGDIGRVSFIKKDLYGHHSGRFRKPNLCNTPSRVLDNPMWAQGDRKSGAG